MQKPLAFALAWTHGQTPHPALAKAPGGLAALFGSGQPQPSAQNETLAVCPLQLDRKQPRGAGSIHCWAERRAFAM